MIALRDIQARPAFNDRCGVGRTVGTNQPRYFVARGFDGFAALAGTFSKCFGSNVGCTDGKQVFAKFSFGDAQLLSSVIKFNGARCSNGLHVFEGLQGNRFNVRVKQVAHDCCSVVASTRGKSTSARVHGVTLASASSAVRCASAHDASAARASADTGKQGGFVVDAGLACSHWSLRACKYVFGNDRWVRAGVGVFANGQFAKVNTVAENVAGAVCRYAKLHAKLGHWFASDRVVERDAKFGGLLVGNEAPRVGVFVVAVGNDCALPDATFGRGCALRVKAFTMKVKFVFGYRGKHCACEAASRRTGVNVLRNGDDLAASGFDAVPELEQVRYRSRGARQVCNNESAVQAVFDSFDGFGKDWPVAVAATGIEFGREDRDVLVSVARPSFNGGCLIVGGTEAVSVAAPYMTDSNVTNPGFIHPENCTGLTTAVNYQPSLAPNKGRARV